MIDLKFSYDLMKCPEVSSSIMINFEMGKSVHLKMEKKSFENSEAIAFNVYVLAKTNSKR